MYEEEEGIYSHSQNAKYQVQSEYFGKIICFNGNIVFAHSKCNEI